MYTSSTAVFNSSCLDVLQLDSQILESKKMWLDYLHQESNAGGH